MQDELAAVGHIPLNTAQLCRKNSVLSGELRHRTKEQERLGTENRIPQMGSDAKRITSSVSFLVSDLKLLQRRLDTLDVFWYL